jgi:crotonobetainyl-CoA:carnitine CoA-transferase CaiB-like acyl-CoA transferase
MSGIMETTGTDETGPVKVGAPFIDYAAGQKGAFATMAAIMEQRRTGRPQHVDNAMLDSALLLMANTLTATANTGTRPAKLGNQAASGTASSGCFDTADGLLALAANNDRQFRNLCLGIGEPGLADDNRFSGLAERQANAAEFRQILADRLLTHSAAQWEQTLDRVGVPASRVRSLDGLIDEGQPEARELLADIEVAGTAVQVPTMGVKINGAVPGPVQPPPGLGADNERILRGLGYSADDIEALRDLGVI